MDCYISDLIISKDYFKNSEFRQLAVIVQWLQFLRIKQIFQDQITEFSYLRTFFYNLFLLKLIKHCISLGLG